MVESRAAVLDAVPPVSPHRIAAVIRAAVVAIGIVAGACRGTPPTAPEQVPAAYLAVRASAGHVAHVGKITCAACHGDTGFAAPPAALCARCHASMITPLHPGGNAPSCRDCHAFGAAPAIADARASCMRC